MQKLKARCPEGLQKYIDLVNAFNIFLKSRKNRSPILAGYKNDLMDLHINNKDIPKLLYDYLFLDSCCGFRKERMATLNLAKSFLGTLASRESTFYSESQSSKEGSLAFITGKESGLFGISINIDFFTQYYRIENGIIKLFSNDFFNIIEQNQIEVNRIRLCDNCHSIFWAVRSDSRACSKKCRDSFRQRRWREKDREKYKLMRKANYKRKKELESLRASGKTLGIPKDKKEKENGGL
ncbi:MAG TPA: hypothetical protein VF571_06925 [Pyrinomonadaceae bacterium]|jgi:hypothetical protein